MIQRIQSIWLLLAAVFAFLTFSVPFYTGGMAADVNGNVPVTHLNAKSNLLLTVLTVLTGATAFGAIFMFENRKRQLKMVILGLVFTIALLVVYILNVRDFTTGSFAISCVIHFGILAFFILAIRGIRKDEKLIKSLDRLR